MKIHFHYRHRPGGNFVIYILQQAIKVSFSIWIECDHTHTYSINILRDMKGCSLIFPVLLDVSAIWRKQLRAISIYTRKIIIVSSSGHENTVADNLMLRNILIDFLIRRIGWRLFRSSQYFVKLSVTRFGFKTDFVITCTNSLTEYHYVTGKLSINTNQKYS